MSLTGDRQAGPGPDSDLVRLGLDRATAPLGEGAPATDLVGDLAARVERLTDALSYLVLRSAGLLPEKPATAA